MVASDLGRIFCDRVGAVVVMPRLEETLRAVMDSVRRAWPRLTVADESFVGYLGELVGLVDDPCATLATLHCADLYFAWALSQGDAAAVAAFDELLLRQTARFVGRMALSPMQLDDVVQDMRIKLLVPSKPGAPPKITQYRGQNSFESWLCTVAIRTALDQRRHRGHEELSVVEVLAVSTDPEIKLLRLRHERACADALKVASSALTSRERRLLRLYYREHYSFEELGWLFNVNQTTARRWLLQARDGLIERTRALLRAQLRVNAAELDNLLALMQSRLDVSLGCILGSEP
jgi:RNA polymerase sigma-70 factor (ECF subfamily)